MALDANTRKGFDGRELPLELEPGTPIRMHGRYDDFIVEFVEYTGEVALPREGGAVVRVAFNSGVTDTLVASELSLPR